MNKLAAALMGNGGSGGSAPTQGPGALAANAPMASAPTTASPARGLGPIAGTPPAPPASPRPPSPTAPAGVMTTPPISANIRTTAKAAPATVPAPAKTAADKLRAVLKQSEMPKGMRPIEPPKPPAPPKPFKPKDPGTTKGFTLGATAGTI